MEIICLDSDILIEFYRSKNKRNTVLFKLTKEYQFSIPAIVKYEILRGNKKKDKFWNSFFQETKILPFDDECSQVASEIYQNLKQKHNLIGTDDILIAATAIKHNCSLATLNKKHFSRIKNVNLINI